ncbi:MAG: response regulator [Phycisphaerales bacterium]|jgi:CheY-like chemotaxis protein|nr:response regulator [Phycisphaerales bacterium]
MMTLTPTKLQPANKHRQEMPSITILLVDDDPDCRMLIRDAITECKVSNSIFEVSNGREAMEFLHRRGRYADAPRPGLIYLDIEMPEMDGQEVLRQIKASPELRDIPVVMMTGVSDEGQMKLAAENGANSYTLKPANAEQFLRTVLASTNYWLTIHQYPERHLPASACRR